MKETKQTKEGVRRTEHAVDGEGGREKEIYMFVFDCESSKWQIIRFNFFSIRLQFYHLRFSFV